MNSFAKAQNHFQNVHTRKEGKGKGVFLSSKISRKVVFLHLGEFQPTPLGVGLLCFEGPRGQDNGSPQEPVQQGALHGNQSPLDRQFMTTTMLPLREMIIVSFHRWGTGSKSRGLPRATQLGSGNVSSLCHESFSYCHFLIILGIDLRLLHASSLKFKVNTQTLGLRIDSEVSLTYGEQCFAPLTPALGWLCSHLCLLPSPHMLPVQTPGGTGPCPGLWAADGLWGTCMPSAGDKVPASVSFPFVSCICMNPCSETARACCMWKCGLVFLCVCKLRRHRSLSALGL